MSREVYTYKRINDLPRQNYWNEIKEYPHITVSRGLKRTLKNSNQSTGHTEGLFKKDRYFNVISFSAIQGKVLPNWTTAESRYGAFSLISTCISRMIRECREDDEDTKKLLSGCKNNRDRILYTIELMEESGVSDDLFARYPDVVNPVAILASCWSFLLDNSNYINSFRAAMETLKDRAVWDDILSSLFGIDSPENVNKLVFHGFYYLTPLQKWIIDCAEEAGFGIIYLFPYDDRHRYVYESWERTYAGMERIATNTWVKGECTAEDLYADIFSGKENTPTNKIRIHEYRSIVDFSKRVATQRNVGVGIYSPSGKIINDPLMAVIPEEYGERKLLSYPIGKFLLTVCGMWDDVEGSITADEKSIFECFSSGWLNDGEYKGQDYLYELHQLMPFFADCKGAAQWDGRLVELEQIYSAVIPELQTTYDGDTSSMRWQSFMGNPLACFSQFSLEPSRVNVVINLIRKLLGLANSLFENMEQITVQQFVGKLLDIISCCEISEDVYKEESKIANEILKRLRDSSDKEIKVYPNDAASAIGLYLNDDFSNEDIAKERSVVKNIYEIETAEILYSGKVHLCMCDSDHLPGGKKQYPWPFSRVDILSLRENYDLPLLSYLINTLENGYIANRYFFYVALRNRDVELSWIKNLSNKEYIHSCYLDLVSLTLGIKIPDSKGLYVDSEYVKGIAASTEKVNKFHFAFNSEQMPKEAKMDYVICPIKYVYNHVLDSKPSFNDDFHQSYAMNALIKTIAGMLDLDSSEVIENVLGLFPQLSDAVKSQVEVYVKGQEEFHDNSFAGMTKVGKKYFTEERLKTYFADKSVRDEAIKKYGEYVSKEEPERIDFNRPANGGENEDIYSRSNPCLFCQFQEHCRRSMFINDTESLYDKA
ncbi:hypothetical protein [Butyrivibrio sp. NC2007]|uniref:hypothetical protein n=1 Tax=Butyrivibrio sp. NC2007 TaxID=1280683 RepID=UPI0003B4D450|nr:hypothetical protein [Butyrivibrio sp. NC2007]